MNSHKVKYHKWYIQNASIIISGGLKFGDEKTGILKQPNVIIKFQKAMIYRFFMSLYVCQIMI